MERTGTPTTERARSTVSDLPGAELVARGLADLRAGRETVEALLVQRAATRLRAAGLHIPGPVRLDADQRMYALLQEQGQDPDAAYATYNALRARLVSFCHALEQHRRSAALRNAAERVDVDVLLSDEAWR